MVLRYLFYLGYDIMQIMSVKLGVIKLDVKLDVMDDDNCND